MRICIITSAKFPPEEGLGKYVFNLSQELIKKGHEVTVITRGDFRGTKFENFEGIKLYRVTFLPLYPLHVHFHKIFVGRLLNKLYPSIDLVHYHSPLPPAIHVNIPIVTTVHSPVKTSIDRDPNPLTVRLQSRISYLIERDIFQMSDVITSVSTSVSRELSDYDIDPSNVVVIGNGVNEREYCPISKKPDKKYILFVGRITHQKGVTDFIDCATKLSQKYSDIYFKMAGKGELLDDLKERVKSAGLEDRFEFLGHISHNEKNRLIELYQNAFLFVLPSHYEGLPTTLLEAMSCGLPVVSTAVSGSLDVIEAGKNGLLIPVRSPDEMIRAISSLIDDDNKRICMGNAARETIELRFTWERIANKVIDCYESALEKGHTIQ